MRSLLAHQSRAGRNQEVRGSQVTHHDIEAIEKRLRFDRIAGVWIQRVAAFAGVAVLILLIGELL
jgi:hypothetical protein